MKGLPAGSEPELGVWLAWGAWSLRSKADRGGDTSTLRKARASQSTKRDAGSLELKAQEVSGGVEPSDIVGIGWGSGE